VAAPEGEGVPLLGASRPALAWALKEAAAKACGGPSPCFPLGLRITATARGLFVEVLGSGTPGFTSGWGLLDEFLYAWVRGGVAG
jgi:phosphopantetheinyl transferase (holo-ACP synthase)